MLSVIGAASRQALIESIVPPTIVRRSAMELPASVSEAQALAEMRELACQNQVLKSFIGQGYYGTHTPKVILRNILENPAWYTAYTPYQAEISQGRLEALVNFQTMICDLTGMAIANASMLDEATAAAEAMTLAKRSVKSKSDTVIVASDCHPQTIEVLRTRAEPLGLKVVVGVAPALMAEHDYGECLIFHPDSSYVREVVESVPGAYALVWANPRVPGFLGAIGPRGPIGYATGVTITETDAPGGGDPVRVVIEGKSPSVTLTLDLSVQPGFLPLAFDRRWVKAWADPIVGVAARYRVNNDWFLTGIADVGGFGVGSRLTAQGVAAVGYNWNANWSSSIGYRVLYTDYRAGGFSYRVTQHGPFTTLSYKF